MIICNVLHLYTYTCTRTHYSPRMRVAPGYSEKNTRPFLCLVWRQPGYSMIGTYKKNAIRVTGAKGLERIMMRTIIREQTRLDDESRRFDENFDSVTRLRKVESRKSRSDTHRAQNTDYGPTHYRVPELDVYKLYTYVHCREVGWFFSNSRRGHAGSRFLCLTL